MAANLKKLLDDLEMAIPDIRDELGLGGGEEEGEMDEMPPMEGELPPLPGDEEEMPEEEMDLDMPPMPKKKAKMPPLPF